ncbi:MAG: hypothetical protein JKY52_12610, partial [Flavobacteriales bacterium]|nr:hypothetical protein [Flavobacteriales bacterium]
MFDREIYSWEVKTAKTKHSPQVMKAKQKKLLNSTSYTDTTTTKIAHSFHHLMAASNAKKSSTSSGQTLFSSENVTANTLSYGKSIPSMQQPIGTAMPNQIIPVRTLTYINRKKIMNMDALKESIQSLNPD